MKNLISDEADFEMLEFVASALEGVELPASGVEILIEYGAPDTFPTFEVRPLEEDMK